MSFFLAGSTAQEQIVDSFEDQDLSEYGADTGSYSTITTGGVIKDGSVGLKHESSSDGVIASTSGLDNYPSQGDTFRCWMRGSSDGNDDTARQAIFYGKADETDTLNGYQVRLDYPGDSLDLIDPGGTVIGSTSTSTISIDNNYEIEVFWGEDDSHNITLYNESGTDLGSLSVTDSTRTSGGIGFRGSIGQNATIEYWDYYRITS